MNIYISHLNSRTGSQDLMDLLGSYGIVHASKVRSIMEVRNRTFNTFAYVEIDSDVNGLRAIAAYDNAVFMGRKINLAQAG
jgi:RNA recognition motif-containing protein